MKIMNKESRRKENDDNAEDYESEMKYSEMAKR